MLYLHALTAVQLNCLTAAVTLNEADNGHSQEMTPATSPCYKVGASAICPKLLNVLFVLHFHVSLQQVRCQNMKWKRILIQNGLSDYP